MTTLSRVMPALLTTTVSGPSSLSARSTMAFDLLLVGDVAHHDEALAPERLDLGDDRRAGASPAKSLTATSAPAAASASAMARPMPRPAPVTRAARAGQVQFQ